MTTFGELSLGDHFQLGDRMYVKTDNGCCRDVATRQTVRDFSEHTPVERSLEEHGWHISLYYWRLVFGEER